MRYMGSKSRIAKYIVPIIQQCIDDNNIEYYIEPFVGGANVIDKIICKNKSGSDKNEYLIALLDYVSRGGELLPNVPRELYNEVRTAYNSNLNTFSKVITANVGFLASYNGRWFDGGYAQSGFEKTKHGERYRDYYQESKRNLEAQAKDLVGINFSCHDYRELPMATTLNNMVYCDPPYANTKQYANSQNFDFDEFWETMRQWSKSNYVLISGMYTPDDFVCIWQKPVSRSIRPTDKSIAVEKIFTHNDGLYMNKNKTAFISRIC